MNSDYIAKLAMEFENMPFIEPNTIYITELTYHILQLGKKKFRGKKRWFKKVENIEDFLDIQKRKNDSTILHDEIWKNI